MIAQPTCYADIHQHVAIRAAYIKPALPPHAGRAQADALEAPSCGGESCGAAEGSLSDPASHSRMLLGANWELEFKVSKRYNKISTYAPRLHGPASCRWLPCQGAYTCCPVARPSAQSPSGTLLPCVPDAPSTWLSYAPSTCWPACLQEVVRFGERGQADGQFEQAGGLHVDNDGTVFIAGAVLQAMTLP